MSILTHEELNELRRQAKLAGSVDTNLLNALDTCRSLSEEKNRLERATAQNPRCEVCGKVPSVDKLLIERANAPDEHEGGFVVEPGDPKLKACAACYLADVGRRISAMGRMAKHWADAADARFAALKRLVEAVDDLEIEPKWNSLDARLDVRRFYEALEEARKWLAK